MPWRILTRSNEANKVGSLTKAPASPAQYTTELKAAPEDLFFFSQEHSKNSINNICRRCWVQTWEECVITEKEGDKREREKIMCESRGENVFVCECACEKERECVSQSAG